MRSGHFRPYSGSPRDHALILKRDRIGKLSHIESAQNGKGDLCPDALHALQEAEPAALRLAQEAVKLDRIFPDMRLDGERNGFPRRGQHRQCPRGARNLIPDATHIDDGVIRADRVDQPSQFPDHGRKLTRV